VHIKASGGINFNEFPEKLLIIISAICSLWPKSGTAKCITRLLKVGRLEPSH